MAFDVEGARKAGYSETEIADHLAATANLDAAAARKAGHSDADLIKHLTAGDKKPAPSMIGSALRGAVQGITFGFGDELRAGTDALVQGAGNLFHTTTLSDLVTGRPTMGQAYDRSLAASREDLRADREQNPITSAGGELTGAAGSAVLTPGLGVARVAAPLVARAAPWVNALLPNLPSWLQTGTRIAGTGTRLAAEGAVQGGVAGFGEGEGGVANRAGSAGTGAVTGAVVAPVAGAAIHAAPVVGGRVAETLGLRNPQTAADRQILRSLDRAGTNVDEVETRLSAGGNSPLALVDVGGRNTVNLGATAANTPSTSMDVADRFVQARREGRPERLTEAGDVAFGGGSGGDIAATQAAREAGRKAAADPLYDAVRAHGPVDNPDVAAHLLTLPDEAFADASKLARLAGSNPARLIADGKLTRVPTADDLTHIVEGLGTSIERAQRAGEGTMVRALTIAKNKLTGLLDDIIVDPATGQRIYADARAAYAGPSAQMEATEAGRKALTSDRDVVAERMQAAPDVQDAYRLGAGRQFSDMASDPARDVNFARKMAEDRNNQARLQALLDQPQLNDLNAVLRRERDMGQVEQSVSPRAGAQTKRLLAGGEDMGRDPVGPLLTAAKMALSGSPMQGANMAWGEAYRRIGQGINASTANALADRLFATDPAARAQVLAALRNQLLTDTGRAAVLRRFIEPALTATQRTAGGYAGRND